MPLYEMIETIILSFLHTGCTTGTFGSVTRDEAGIFTVNAAGSTFTAYTNAIGWSVTAGDFEGVDCDLIEAARLAVTA